MSMSAESSALVQSMSWIERLMIGPFAVSLAVIAVAVTGLLMLRGHLPLEATFRLVIGCFIIFGAPAIALGIVNAAQKVALPNTWAGPTSIARPSKPPVTYDPYAGAATPIH
jgi:type IV secretory pathway VirB2 component (pilin)